MNGEVIKFFLVVVLALSSLTGFAQIESKQDNIGYQDVDVPVVPKNLLELAEKAEETLDISGAVAVCSSKRNLNFIVAYLTGYQEEGKQSLTHHSSYQNQNGDFCMRFYRKLDIQTFIDLD